MKRYEDIDENSNGATLKKAREDYAKRNNMKFGQKELANYLGVPPSTVGLWEQDRRTIPSTHFKKLDLLLGTNFNQNIIVDENCVHYYAALYFYFGLYNFTQKQYDYIIATLLIAICRDILNKEQIDNYENVIYSCKINKLFDTVTLDKIKKCQSYIKDYLESLYHKTESSYEQYISEISGKTLNKNQRLTEIHHLLTSLDSSKVVDSTHQNVPVYNSAGILEYYEELPNKFSKDKYKYFYIKLDNLEGINFPCKYEEGSLVLVRQGNFCFYNEDILIQCGKEFAIKHIKFQTDLEKALRENFGVNAIIENGYEVIGAIVLIDYSTSALISEDSKIEF